LVSGTNLISLSNYVFQVAALEEIPAKNFGLYDTISGASRPEEDYRSRDEWGNPKTRATAGETKSHSICPCPIQVLYLLIA